MLYKCDLPVIDVYVWSGDNLTELIVSLSEYGASDFRRSSDGIFFYTIAGDEYSTDLGEAIIFDPAKTGSYPLYMDPVPLRELYSPQEQ